MQGHVHQVFHEPMGSKVNFVHLMNRPSVLLHQNNLDGALLHCTFLKSK